MWRTSAHLFRFDARNNYLFALGSALHAWRSRQRSVRARLQEKKLLEKRQLPQQGQRQRRVLKADQPPRKVQALWFNVTYRQGPSQRGRQSHGT